MAEGEILTPAAPDVATPTTDVPAVSTPSEPAKIDYSKVSDEDIRQMDLSKPKVETAEESETETEVEEPETAAETTETKPVAAETKEVSEEVDDEDEFRPPEPEDLKRAFKAHPKLRDAWYRDQKFREVIGSVKEAREYKELFGTVDDARMASDHARALLTLDQLYATNPGELLSKLNTGNANAFVNLMSQSREVFHSLNPEAYRQHVAQPIMTDWLENAKEFAETEGDENFQAALEIVANRMGWGQNGPKAKPAPRQYDPRLKKLEAYEQRDADAYRASLYNFSSAVDRGVVDGIQAEINATFDRLPTNGILPGVKAVVAQQLVADVMQALEANQYLTNVYNSQKLSGQMTEANLKALVTSRLAQAKPLIGKRVASMLKKLTADTLAANQQELKKGVEASQRKEVGTGSGQGIAPMRSGKIDYRRTSNEDIRLGRITYRK